jgi:hypothetical protein
VCHVSTCDLSPAVEDFNFMFTAQSLEIDALRLDFIFGCTGQDDVSDAHRGWAL